jgi:[glutamine synthetase] adenylyltransferase / [glutamine synthetase]-adenylyl-L-tyrosine phosphorylase
MLNQIDDDELKAEVSRVVGLSPFFGELLEQSPDFLVTLGSSCDALSRAELNDRYRRFLSEGPDDVPAALRLLRRREMMRIIFRDLTRKADLFETTAELSQLADFCVQTALDDCYQAAVARYGQPLSPRGLPEQLIVLGMGKLGAYELNLSSDIDLIFFYTHQGTLGFEQNGRDQTISFQEFFIRLARQLISHLDDAGSIANVFRVDMRLRPYGDSGPLVIHRAAMEKYYLEQGRDWERYAFIKARAIAGDLEGGRDFLSWLRPFIYRRHQDYGAVQSLREMKGLITRQIELNEMSHDLKLGPGGIREIEFIAQAHQLIWGGKHLGLQKRELFQVLESLVAEAFLPAEEVSALKDAYIFLRNSEHAVQAEFDRQTHLLPVDDVSQRRLADAMGYDDFSLYLVALEAHRARVTQSFDQLVSNKGTSPHQDIGQAWVDGWQSPDNQYVEELRQEIRKLQLDDGVVACLDALMPRLLMLIGESADPEIAMVRMLAIARSVLRRSTYLVFLDENPDALLKAVQLVILSPWIADQLESYPILLYDLTDRALREVSVAKLELEGELRELMRIVDAGDLESQMDTLRQFKLSATVKIAAMELLDKLSIMQASDGLTALAEVILETSVDIAWSYLENRHGRPTDESGNPMHSRLAIIAYGKAGGFELAYGSDLDLVFLCPSYIQGNTDGRSTINNNVFYVRFGQRVIHILTSFTRFGILYSADMRLRPQGNKGPLVATIGAFQRYQETEAWTWEHQALIRARFVAGDVELGAAFNVVRRNLIARERDPELLLQEVCSMRQRMRDHLATPAAGRPEDGIEILGKFDLKHDSGAIVDIEFMVQYAVLAWASRHEGLGRWTDVMRLLDELESAGLMPGHEVEALQRAYLAFRAAVHHGWLGLDTDFERLQRYRQEVHRIWLAHMEAGDH